MAITPFISGYIEKVKVKLNEEEELKLCEEIRKDEAQFRIHNNMLVMHHVIMESKNTKVNVEIYKILEQYYPNNQRKKEAFDYWMQTAILDEYFVKTMIITSNIIPSIISYNNLLHNNNIVNSTQLMNIIKIILFYGYFENKFVKKDLDDDLLNILLTHFCVTTPMVINYFENNDKNADIINARNLAKNNNIHIKTKQEIFDIFILYSLPINKEIVLMLLDIKISINSLEKFGIDMDENIYIKCIQKDFYPYKLTCPITDKIIHEELKKSKNILKVKELKEHGGEFNTCCLEVACSVLNNYTVLKFLVNELKIISNETCMKNLIKIHSTTYIQDFDLLIQNYTNKKILSKKDKKIVKLDNESTLNIIPKKIIDKNTNYSLKKKIKNFLKISDKIEKIEYEKICEFFITYLIVNNLVIGNYFVINSDLSKLLKINCCSILHIDEIDNLITYFVE